MATPTQPQSAQLPAPNSVPKTIQIQLPSEVFRLPTPASSGSVDIDSPLRQ